MKDENKCIHCHKCQESCDFLKKYHLDLGDTERFRELAYHCFLCGKCKEICPEGIDGRTLSMKYRRMNPQEDTYKFLLFEKKNYIFKNYRKGKRKRVLFPGCNFPSFYPKTTKKLVKICEEYAGIGVIYECCGKPVEETGIKDNPAVARINSRFRELGIEEIIVMCPNCFYFLKEHTNIKVTSVYELLCELGIKQERLRDIAIFMPCPDRETGEFYQTMQYFLVENTILLKKEECCGLGGLAVTKEPELAKKKAQAYAGQGIYTYCASCAGNFARNGCSDVKHLLVNLLDTNEKTAVKTSFLHRMQSKFW